MPRPITRRQALQQLGLAAASIPAAQLLPACQSTTPKTLATTLPIKPAKPPKLATIHPTLIPDVLLNPGIGFMTFQRFNGDKLNEGTRWTEGSPIDYSLHTGQPGNLEVPHHPMTSLAYFRLYWKYLEPNDGQYNWPLLDKALQTAADRNQTLLFRLAPYASAPDNDLPDWYRKLLGPEPNLPNRWRTNPEDPRYAKYFGRMIRALGQRYNNHPHLESVDLSIVGPYGEGSGSEALSEKTRRTLVDAYTDSFPDTPLIMLLTDHATNSYGLAKKPRGLGWRTDCLGDLGGFSPDWNHMLDLYPESIINAGMQHAWKTGPVSFEVCWVMQTWLNKGWDIDYIIEQSLKWHISSFNAKSSPVPDQWKPNVDRWLNRMGYRLALRRLTFPQKLQTNQPLTFTTWWENLGVAPPYRPYRFAFRLQNENFTTILPTTADLTQFLPGDTLHDAKLTLPPNTPAGTYDLSIAILDPKQNTPKIQLAIANRDPDGWYKMGPITIEQAQ